MIVFFVQPCTLLAPSVPAPSRANAAEQRQTELPKVPVVRVLFPAAVGVAETMDVDVPAAVAEAGPVPVAVTLVWP